MARKASTKSKKTSRTRKSKTTSRKASSRRGTSSRKAQGKKKSARGQTAHPSPRGWALPRLPLPRWQLSPERKRALWGVGFVALGLLTGASLLATGSGTLRPWAGFWHRALGWGVWLFPLWLLAWGGGLLLGEKTRLPTLTPERGIGLVVFYVALLAVLHAPWVATGAPRAAWFAPAAAGRGGGYVGAFLAWALVTTVGRAGALVMLAAGLVLGWALVLGRPVWTLFGWVPRWGQRLGRGLRGLGAKVWRMARPNRRRAGGIRPAGTALSPAAATMAQELAASEETEATEKPAWVLPDIAAMLDEAPEESYQAEETEARARLIEETLALFNAPGKVVEVLRGPTVTLYGVEPGYVEGRKGQTKVRVSKIASLADDLALALSAKRVRIQAPVPGKGYVGIEVPNEQAAAVTLRQVIESEAFRRLQSPLRFALGKDVAGNPVAADLTAMPHLLIAGATGSGKSVCVNGIITCLLLHNTPDDLRLLLVDPKRVELSGYNGIPHLLAPVVVDLERVVGALQWVNHEMERRYKLFAKAGARHIADYNRSLEKQGREKLPYLVVVIDELADLMMIAPDTTERAITRLAQLARATGIHLILATQRPSTDVVTGLIKANFPARIAFAVASGVDSRVILDRPGAERLLGRGDMLFLPPDAPEPMRLQGVFVSNREIRRVVDYWRGFGPAEAPGGEIVDAPPQHLPLKQKPIWEELEGEPQEPQQPADPLWAQAVAVVREEGKASASLLQRRLRIGYTRAARLVDMMEDRGIVGPPQPGSGIRRVLPPAPEGEEKG